MESNKMKTLISARMAGNILLISLGILTIFHILVLLNVVSPDIVWGGQAGNTEVSLLILEIVALLVTALMAVIIAAKIGYIQAGRFKVAVNIGIWIVVAYLLLNMLGNLASGVSAEGFIFAPITLILALFALRLAIKE